MSGGPLNFAQDELVVVPGCGVGRIEAIETMETGDEPVEMYKIFVESTGVRMWVPTYRAAADGYRRPLDEDRIDAVLEMIRDTTAPDKRATWNRRQRRYQELLMSNDPMQLAALLGELASVRQAKALSFGERKMFDRACELMSTELQSATAAKNIVKRFEDALTA